MNCSERMLAACRRGAVDRPPVWLMRQAGRYLPEYRELRSKHGFWEMVKTPALAVEVSMQPIRRFGMDAAIVFSDILIVLDALGVRVSFEKDGPDVGFDPGSTADVKRLAGADISSSFDYLGEAVERLSAACHPERAVIGFCGAPFTLAAYLVAKGPSKDVTPLKVLAERDPGLYAQLAGTMAVAAADVLKTQIGAGADVVQMFDTWAGQLSPADYKILALPYVRQVVAEIKPMGVPIILYMRNSSSHIEAAASSGCDVVSVDCSLTLADARARAGLFTALQGNHDPALLSDPPARIREAVRAGMSEAGQGYLVNLGQGVLPGTPVEGVEAFVNAVREAGA